jgi:hypothetical protein
MATFSASSSSMTAPHHPSLTPFGHGRLRGRQRRPHLRVARMLCGLVQNSVRMRARRLFAMTNFGPQPALAAALWSAATPLAAEFLCLACRVMSSRRDTHTWKTTTIVLCDSVTFLVAASLMTQNIVSEEHLMRRARLSKREYLSRNDIKSEI